MKLSDIDNAFLTRLFGAELVLSDPDVRAFADDATAIAKAVDWSGEGDAEVAISCLVASVVDRGIEGFPMGWSVQTANGRTTLAVHRMKPASAIAA